MSTEKIRDGFRAWLLEMDILRDSKGLEPITAREAELMEQAWIESRAAVVITLPCSLKAEPISDRGAGFNTGMAFCEAMIRDAGMKVK